MGQLDVAKVLRAKGGKIHGPPAHSLPPQQDDSFGDMEAANVLMGFMPSDLSTDVSTASDSLNSRKRKRG